MYARAEQERVSSAKPRQNIKIVPVLGSFGANDSAVPRRQHPNSRRKGARAAHHRTLTLNVAVQLALVVQIVKALEGLAEDDRGVPEGKKMAVKRSNQHDIDQIQPQTGEGATLHLCMPTRTRLKAVKMVKIGPKSDVHLLARPGLHEVECRAAAEVLHDDPQVGVLEI